MKELKKMLIFILIVSALVGGCRKNRRIRPGAASKTSMNKLAVWSFSEELNQMINGSAGFRRERSYAGTHPDVQIEYTMTPRDQFPDKLDPLLFSGTGTPDVFALESSFVRKYIESGLLLDLTDIYEANKSKLLAYPIQIGSYEGRVYGLAWQATPGAFFYRRSFAKKYLGTDDPVKIQAMAKDFDSFLELAETLKQRSKGLCATLASPIDLLMLFLNNRAEPFVVDQKLVVDPVIYKLFDYAKLIRNRGYDARLNGWDEAWFSSLKDLLTDENGRQVEVFAYFLPTWGLHYILKPNAPEKTGDYAMCQGPVPYYMGGTWLAAYKNTKKPAEAKELIRYLTTDDGFLEAWARTTGDLVCNIDVIDKIKNDYHEPFLGGQNHYAEFAEMAKRIDGRLAQSTDLAITGTLTEALISYITGEKTKEKAIEDWKIQTSNMLGLD